MQRLKRVEMRLRRLRNAAAPVLYAGSAVCCPICERSFRKFRSAGRLPAKRLNAVCPRCGSRERDRLAFLFLRRLTPTGRILHVAPEACLMARLRELATVACVTADLVRTDVHERVDLHALPHRDATFGGVYCSHVLQDVRDDVGAMIEVFRVLAPGGWAILNVPVTAEYTVEHPDAPLKVRAAGDPRPPEHLRTYGADFPDRMASAGFRVCMVCADDVAPGTQQRRLGIAERTAGTVYFGTKP